MIDFGLKTGQPVRFVGPPGTGKTSVVIATVRERDCIPVYFSLATLSAEDLAVVAPTRTIREIQQDDGTVVATSVMELETLLFDVLANDDPKVIILDEYSRCDKRTMAAVMSLINEGQINGKLIPNLKGIFALDNPDDGTFMVSTADHAQSTRFGAHVLVSANDIPWREALLKKYEGRFDSDTLERLFRTWEGFSPKVREAISPRVMDWMLSNTAYGMPITWAIGVDGLDYFEIHDDAEVDVTGHTLAAIAAAIGGSVDPGFEFPAVEALESSIARAKDGIRANLRLVGHAGFAKTAYIVDRLVAEYGERGVVPFSLATTSPENWGVPVPATVSDEEDAEQHRKLLFLLHDRFNDDIPKVLLLDEFSRAGKRTLNAVMEIVQEGTLNGHPIRGLQFVVALDNPTGKKDELNGVAYATERLDRAQATRFAMTIPLRPQDLPWKSYLEEKYGSVAAPFLDWWASGLDEPGKIQANARVLEKMILLFQEGQDIELALPLGYGNQRMGPDLTNLKAALRNERVVTLAQIVKEEKEYCEILADPSHPDWQERFAEAANAFELISDVATLEQHKSTIKSVSAVMGKQWKTTSVTSVIENKPVLQWWIDLWKEVQAEIDAAAQAAGAGV